MEQILFFSLFHGLVSWSVRHSFLLGLYSQNFLEIWFYLKEPEEFNSILFLICHTFSMLQWLLVFLWAAFNRSKESDLCTLKIVIKIFYVFIVLIIVILSIMSLNLHNFQDLITFLFFNYCLNLYIETITYM